LSPIVSSRIKAKPYTLVCADKFEADSWLAALRSWIEPSSEVVTIQVASLSNTPVLSSAASSSSSSLLTSSGDEAPLALRSPAAAAVATANADASKMHGWLLKKGKRRYFFIEGGVLYWATKELHPAQCDYRKLANGSLELRDCTVTRLDEKTIEVTSYAGANYTLHAALPSEAEQWCLALLRTLQMFGQSRHEALGDPWLEHRGYLLKKGQRRFLLLKRMHLFWFVSEHESTPKGSLPLSRCTVSPLGAMGFKITSSDFKDWEWSCRDAAEAQTWVEKIRAASQAAKRTEMTARTERLKVSGTTQADVTEVFFKQTWVKKNGQARVLQLRGNTLLWFDRLNGSDDPANCKNSINLAGTSAEIDAASPVEVVLLRSAGDTAPRRFVCPDSSTAAEWVDLITRASQRATSALAAASTASSGDALRRGYMVAAKGLVPTKGGRRYYVLSAVALQWYATEEDVARGAQLGCLPLASCRVALNTGDSSHNNIGSGAGATERLLVYEPTGAKLMLTCATTADAMGWHTSLTKAIANANRVLQPDRVFGVPLAEIEGRLREKQRGELPAVLASGLDWLIKRGATMEGIFRLSGDMQVILTFKDMFDRGLHVTFPPGAAVHDVAGVVKLWLRELPEPLFTFDLYSPVLALSDGDAAGMRALLQTLPAINMRVLRSLMRCLIVVLQHEETNKMSAKNLAIVFGPTLMRPPPSDDAPTMELRDTPKVLELTRLILQQHGEIFGDLLRTNEPVAAAEHGDSKPSLMSMSARVPSARTPDTLVRSVSMGRQLRVAADDLPTPPSQGAAAISAQTLPRNAMVSSRAPVYQELSLRAVTVTTAEGFDEEASSAAAAAPVTVTRSERTVTTSHQAIPASLSRREGAEKDFF
jgi:hypothetical protein